MPCKSVLPDSEWSCDFGNTSSVNTHYVFCGVCNGKRDGDVSTCKYNQGEEGTVRQMGNITGILSNGFDAVSDGDGVNCSQYNTADQLNDI
ncbi:hypothetical protein BaRGS_00001494 [Batillaria attramentaria]|uniref:Uncharacterized protein n=1 Tax=Batillaria attramentaria TaxID=370345 RepID=A0ABD0M6H5_9CAEN